MIRAPAESISQKTGSSSRSAISVARTIFSTVRAPQEPALTVGSLATTTAGRPSTRPRPVTTPSAGRPASQRVGVAAVLDERALVDEQRDPVAHIELRPRPASFAAAAADGAGRRVVRRAQAGPNVGDPRVGRMGHCRSPRPRAITMRWTSLVPSPISRILASR